MPFEKHIPGASEPEADAAFTEPDRPAEEWRVYFSGGFWGRERFERAGRELKTDASFIWGDTLWRVPAVYLCGEGLVMDICMEIPPERLKAYADKWSLFRQEERPLTDEERELADSENPLNTGARPAIAVNGSRLSFGHGCSVSWRPFLPEEMQNEPEAENALLHYGLDAARGWTIYRAAFPWATARRPASVKTLSLTLEQEPVRMYGPVFKSPPVGGGVRFVHPVTRGEHLLTVTGYSREELPEDSLRRLGLECPRYYTMMTYTLSPELPDAEILVCDRLKNERPVQINQNEGSSAGVIGGADGPTAVFFSRRAAITHTACSAARFLPALSVEWRVILRKKTRGDITLRIL